MDRRQIAAKLVVDKLGLDFRMDSFSNRLILQKAIYLAQASGVDLGYYFSWYLRGPYCSTLAGDGFAIQEEQKNGSKETQNWHLGDSAKANLRRIQPVFDEKDEGKLARKLELLASIHFLMSRKNLTELSDIHHVCEEYQKGFSLNEIREGMKELKRYGLVQR